MRHLEKYENLALCRQTERFSLLGHECNGKNCKASASFPESLILLFFRFHTEFSYFSIRQEDKTNFRFGSFTPV